MDAIGAIRKKRTWPLRGFGYSLHFVQNSSVENPDNVIGKNSLDHGTVAAGDGGCPLLLALLDITPCFFL
jgi:hypothetical protein